MERLVEILLVNSAAATLLALLAVGAGRVIGKRPAVMHVLWLAVLLKLLAPPVLETALLPPWVSPFAESERTAAAAVPLDAERLEVLLALDALSPAEALPDPGLSRPEIAARAVGGLWLAGTVLLLLLTVSRSLRFRRLVADAPAAPAPLAARARRIASAMGLGPVPRLRLVRGRVPPMLWPRMGPPEVLLPARLFQSLEPAEQDALIAHELAHFSRKDHWVRYLEMLAVALFWWHPVTWWARRRMRAAEERCCDDLVVEALPGRGRAYAEGLLKTVEFLSGRGPMVPAVATGAGESRQLEERLTMIMNPSKRGRLSVLQRWLLAAGAIGALAFFPTWSERAPDSSDGTAGATEFAEGRGDNEPFFAPDVERPAPGDRDAFFGPGVDRASPDDNELFFGPDVEWAAPGDNQAFFREPYRGRLIVRDELKLRPGARDRVLFMERADGGPGFRVRSAAPGDKAFFAHGVSLAPGATGEESAEMARLREQLRELEAREAELRDRMLALERERHQVGAERHRLETEGRHEELMSLYEEARAGGRDEEARRLLETAERLERDQELAEERYTIQSDLRDRSLDRERAARELALEARELQERGDREAARERLVELREMKGQMELSQREANERLAAFAEARAAAEYDRALALASELDAPGREKEARAQYELALRLAKEQQDRQGRDRDDEPGLARKRLELALQELYQRYEDAAAEGDEAAMEAVRERMHNAQLALENLHERDHRTDQDFVLTRLDALRAKLATVSDPETRKSLEHEALQLEKLLADLEASSE